MRNKMITLVCVLGLLGSATSSFAGAYGEAEQPEEMPAPAPAPMAVAVEPESAARILRQRIGFMTDAETARGLWAEIGGMYADYDELGIDVDTVSDTLRLAYGQEMWEAGLELPFFYANVDDKGIDDDDSGIGNLNVYGKVIPIRTDVVSLGGGLVITTPTGNGLFGGDVVINPVTNEYASEDEWGFTPFVTGAVAAGPASLRANVGYQIFTDEDNTLPDDFDNLPYNIAALMPVCDSVSLRGELIGRHYFDFPSNEDDLVTFAPGVDVAFSFTNWNLIMRPTGLVGINDAADWGLGLGLALEQKS